MKTLKTVFFLSALFFLMLQTGCEKDTVEGNGVLLTSVMNVDAFDGIEIDDAFEVELTQGHLERVKIITDENIMPFVVVEVIHGELRIRVESEIGIESITELKVFINFEELRSLELSGATDLVGMNVFNLDDLRIDCSGASSINMEFNADDLDMDISGASDLLLFGNVNDVFLEISGASKLKAFELISDSYDAEVSGASDADIFVLEQLAVRASGASSVIFKGNPAFLDINVTGDSSVEPF